MKSTTLSMLSAFGLLGVTLFSTGCEAPDSQARLDEYSELVGETVPATICPGTQADISGRFFMAMEHSLATKNPIFFDVQITADGDKYDMTFQPLRVYKPAEVVDGPVPREAVGDPIIVEDVAIGADGAFELVFTRAIVNGAANSVTGGEIEATITLENATCSGDYICGDGELTLFRPLSLSNLKAWYTADRIADDFVIMSDTGYNTTCEF